MFRHVAPAAAELVADDADVKKAVSATTKTARAAAEALSHARESEATIEQAQTDLVSAEDAFGAGTGSFEDAEAKGKELRQAELRARVARRKVAETTRAHLAAQRALVRARAQAAGNAFSRESFNTDEAKVLAAAQQAALALRAAIEKARAFYRESFEKRCALESLIADGAEVGEVIELDATPLEAFIPVPGAQRHPVDELATLNEVYAALRGRQ